MRTALSWWQPVGVLVGLELRQRTRGTRWRITCAVAFTAVSAVVFGSLYFVIAGDDRGAGAAYRDFSPHLFTIVICFVGLIGLVVAPTLTATSINGDRKDLTLALVQATPVSAGQLATAKLLGGVLASMTLLVTALPYLIWGIAAAPNPGGCAAGVALLAVLLGCYSGIGLGLSAVTARPLGSAVLTQLAVIFALIGLPVATVLLVPTTMTSTSALRADWTQHGDGTASCVDTTRTVSVARTERIWWLLAANPVVIIGDAVGASARGTGSSMPRRYADYTSEPVDRPPETAFGDLAESFARFRAGPETNQDRPCAGAFLGSSLGSSTRADDAEVRSLVGHTWYWGVSVNLALAGIGVAFAMRRLRIPAGRLPRGVRIA